MSESLWEKKLHSKPSRSRTRACLLQYLYACNKQHTFLDIDDFVKNLFENGDFFDRNYFSHVLSVIQKNEKTLFSLIQKYSTRFDIDTIPFLHICILMIALSEMFFSEEKIPHSISINEAIELAKRYSDGGAKNYINAFLDKVANLPNQELMRALPETPLFLVG